MAIFGNANWAMLLVSSLDGGGGWVEYEVHVPR